MYVCVLCYYATTYLYGPVLKPPFHLAHDFL